MELPDIELAKKALSRTKIYRSPIEKTEVRDKKVAESISPQKLKGQGIKKLHRRGKYLIMELDEGSLLLHGGMTGKFAVYPEKKSLDHTILALHFKNGNHFYFQNPRRFGKCEYVKNWREALSDLGIDPFSNRFTYKNFKEILQGHRGSVKSFLQKQEYIAGLGNVYIDEILWDAKIHPLTKIEDLNGQSLKRLFQSIPSVCRWAEEHLHPPVSTPNLEHGEQPDFLHAYGQDKKTCSRCRKSKIKKRQVAERVTYYCPNCQKKR